MQPATFSQHLGWVFVGTQSLSDKDHCHTKIVTHNFVTRTTLSGTHFFHAKLCHTQLCHTKLFHTRSRTHAPLSQQLYDTQTLSYNLSSTISFLVPFPSHFYTCFVLCVRWKKLTCWVAVSGPIISSATATPISGLNFSCVRRGACSQSSSLPIAGFLPVHEVAYTRNKFVEVNQAILHRSRWGGCGSRKFHNNFVTHDLRKVKQS